MFLRSASVSTLLACMALTALGQELPRWRAEAGALEAEVTPAGLDVLWFKDRWVIGDSHSDPRPAVEGMVLTEGWRAIASTVASAFGRTETKKLADGSLRFRLAGIMRENGGPGEWRWRQVIEMDLTRVTVEYELEERRAPGARVISGGYRLQ
ncbi:MAG: hypothetical protein H5T86_07940, partial [Armatimonadetes bacterium]|nr:hypothetical protein [Armatimonadota bacterium]